MSEKKKKASMALNCIISGKDTKNLFVGGSLAIQCSLWGLSSLARDQTCAPAVEAWSPNHWTTTEVPRIWLLFYVLVACDK